MLYILCLKGKTVQVKNERKYEKFCFRIWAGKCGGQSVNGNDLLFYRDENI